MKFSKGYKVPHSEKIIESYSIRSNHIIMNIDADNYEKVFLKLLKKLKEPTFFILEVPCQMDKEVTLRKTNDAPYHKDVYYLDNTNYEASELILKSVGNILINDGTSFFGFASMNERVEIMKGRYNTIYIYKEGDKKVFTDVLDKLNIPKDDFEIDLAVETFTEEEPGESFKYIDKSGNDIYSILEEFKKIGMYLDHTEEQ